MASAGPAAAGPIFDYLWPQLRRLKADLVDEHFYMPPAWFLANAHRYDAYDRRGPKLFAGEYAAQTSGQARPDNRNNWEGALAEAAFITGLERNADVVVMSSYTSASIDRSTSELILKLVNARSDVRVVRVEVKGAGSLRGEGRLRVLASADLKAENSLDQPTRLAPVESTVAASASGFDLRLEPQSLTVLRAEYSR